ncbi:MAG TPA: alpha/beta fold hydrolase [Steroidobacteraceae bacterium]|nr:alpha/beta fold hydrolase [Steroidobacteraceae bacterium]
MLASKHRWPLLAALALAACTKVDEAPQRLFVAPAVFDLGDGRAGFAERGYLFVPENRDKPQSATIGVHFMRFRSTAAQPATPIFLLAGGPGGSWIPGLTEGTAGIGAPAAGNFRVVLQILEDLRSAADVVVIDQRGAGLSMPQMDCPNHQQLVPNDSPYSREPVTASFQQFARDCKQAWVQRGRDLDGYHAVQLADDIDDLRRALGYQKISLLGGSFGSEWGFVTLRRHPQIIERVVFHGLEGINNTYDAPSEILKSFQAILAAAERDADVAPHVPKGGFLTSIERRIDELGAHPVTVPAKDPITGAPVQVAVGADELRQAWRPPASRVEVRNWPASLLSIVNGDLSAVAAQAAKTKLFNPRPTANHTAMGMAIDCGLSPSAARMTQLAQDPAIKLVGDLNLPYFAICSEWRAQNIHADWLETLRTDVPALFLHGTWDGSTPLSNATEIAGGFSNGHLVVVEGGTHGVFGDLYREQPETIRPLIRRFFAGEPIADAPERVVLAPVDFTPPIVKSNKE